MIALALAAAALQGVWAHTFVEDIYRRWIDEQRRGNGDYRPPRDARLFAPELAALFARDSQLSAQRGGEPIALEYEPLCSCQDDAGLSAHITTPSVTARRATARVRLRFAGGDTAELTLHLVRLPAGWRIGDIATADTPSLLNDLRATLQREH